MATEQGTSTIVVTTEERTWRTNIETPKGGDPVVTAYRETIKTLSDGTVLGRDQMSIRVDRSFSSTVANDDKVTLLNGKVISAVEMAEAVAAFIDMWRHQDAAAESANG